MTISIIIPSFNTAHYLPYAIESVLKSTMSDYEIIVVDDGSVDNTQNVIKPFLEKYSQIKYVYQNNKGLAGARNTGIEKANGEFLVFLDSDDIILPEKLKLQYDFLKNNPEIDLVYSDTICFIDYNFENEIRIKFPKYEGQVIKELLFGNFMHVNSVMVRKSSVLAVNNFNEKYRELEDWDLWLRMSLNGSKFAYIDKLLSKVRVRSDSMTSNQSKMNKAMVNVLDNFLPLLRHNKNVFENINNDYFHALGLFTLKADKKKLFSVAIKGLSSCGFTFTPVFIKLILKRLFFPFLKNQNKTTVRLEDAWKNAK